jgi:hypothetical protein
MANVIYPKCKEALWQGNIDLASSNVKAVLVDLADYTYSAAHEYLSSVAAGARVATSANLASKSFTDGVFDCADFSFTSVTGDQSEALVYYVDSGSDATSRLIAFKDTGITGMPITPDGNNIDVTVNASGVAAL